MRHRRTLIPALLVVSSSLAPWPAAAAPPARSSDAQAEAPAGPAVNINTASVLE